MTEMMDDNTKFPEIYSVIDGLKSEDSRQDASRPQTIGTGDSSFPTAPVTSPRMSHPATVGTIDNLTPIAHLKRFIESAPVLSEDSRICRVRVHSELFDALRTAGGGMVSVSKLVNAILLEFLYNNRGKIKEKNHCAEIEEWMASTNKTINKPH